MMGFRFGYGDGYWNGTTWFIGIIALILIVAVVYEVIKDSKEGYGKNRKGGKDEAIDILYKRLANGDISEEEYKKRKKVLDE